MGINALAVDTIQVLPIRVRRLPPNRIGNPRTGHQVTFVTGVDEHAASKPSARFHRDFDDAPARQLYSALEVETRRNVDGDLVFPQKVLKHLKRHFGFERPPDGRIVCPARRPGRDILITLLKLPVTVIGVLPGDALIEFAGQSPNYDLPAHIGGSQSAAGKAAQVSPRFDQHNRFAHAGRLDRRHHP